MNGNLISIDVGLANGFAVLTSDGDLLLVSEFPVAGEKANRRLLLAELPDLVHQFHIGEAVVEDAMPVRGQGLASSFRYGRAAGAIEGALSALRIPTRFVRPAVWKRAFGVGRTKENMRALAAQRWPAHQAAFKRSKDEHHAEAALLGAWFIKRGLR
jgi:crossover junction endodeoxyribonuclease RuvC